MIASWASTEIPQASMQFRHSASLSPVASHTRPLLVVCPMIKSINGITKSPPLAGLDSGLTPSPRSSQLVHSSQFSAAPRQTVRCTSMSQLRCVLWAPSLLELLLFMMRGLQARRLGGMTLWSWVGRRTIFVGTVRGRRFRCMRLDCRIWLMGTYHLGM